MDLLLCISTSMMHHSVRKTSLTILQHPETGGCNFLFLLLQSIRIQLFGLNCIGRERRFFYCDTEINNLKFRHILHIQLTTHTINSLEDLICPVYYRITLGKGLQQVKQLATPLSAVRNDYDMLMIIT